MIPVHSKRLETTGVKTLIITAKYKHTQLDATLGYFRASVHGGDVENGLFSTISDYLSIDKGWWNPVLFASGRRPCIPRTYVVFLPSNRLSKVILLTPRLITYTRFKTPSFNPNRSMKPDVVFCHGPFHQADYRVAQALLAESAAVISFSDPVAPVTPPMPVSDPSGETNTTPSAGKTTTHYAFGDYFKKGQSAAEEYLKTGQEKMNELMHNRSHSPSPVPSQTSSVATKPNETITTPQLPADAAAVQEEPNLTTVTPEIPGSPPLRRLAILLVGISPHRKLWTTSARPGESVIGYTLLNGAPAIVVPAKDGCPLMAWDTLTLDSLHKIGVVEGAKFDGIVNVLFEYVALCADWDRFNFPEKLEEGNEQDGEKRITSKQETAEILTKDALTLLVAAAIRSKESKEVKKHIDSDRAGIVMLRLP